MRSVDRFRDRLGIFFVYQYYLSFLSISNSIEGGKGGGGGGYDPVSRTNFNKIHASRTVLTKFHES